MAFSPPGRLTVHSSLVLPRSSHGSGFGNLGHQANARSSFGWLSATDAGLQTGYRKKGLPHPAQCPLCDQEGETVQHLLTFVSLLDNFGLTSYSP